VTQWSDETLDYNLGEEEFLAKEDNTHHSIFGESVDEMLSFIKEVFRPDNYKIKSPNVVVALGDSPSPLEEEE
jgi:DNA-binding MltR family transcriptional regulator